MNVIAPYAPGTHALSVIDAYRKGTLSGALSEEALKGLAVPESTASRIPPTLEFLGLLTKDGRPTDDLDLIRGESEEQLTGWLADIVKNAYRPVFEELDVSHASVDEIYEAFDRHYSGTSPQRNQVSLFRILCRRAGLLDDHTAVKPSRPRGELTVLAKAQRNQGAPRGEDTNAERYRALYAHFEELPPDRKWTQTRHDKWLKAITAMLEWAVEIDEQTPPAFLPSMNGTTSSSQE